MPTKDVPASVETERAVLGAILLDNAVFSQVQLDPSDFFLPSHRIIFGTMQEMLSTGSPVDLVTLAEKLSTNGTGDVLAQIGGGVYLSSLTDGTPRLANIEHYVKIVKDHARRRHIIQSSEEIASGALRGDDPDELEKRARKNIRPLKKKTPPTDAVAPEPGTEEFFTLEDGVHAWVHDKDNRALDMWLCAPLEVQAVTCDENGEGWGRLLQWKDQDGRKHSWAMPMQLFAGSGEDFRRAILNGGLEISTLKVAREKLMKYVQAQQPEKRAVSVTKVGWHNGVFVFPDGGIGPGDDLILYQAAQETSHNLRVQGTAEDWKNYVGKLCSGNSRLILAVSCAFAAPLLGMTDSESGGFHFYGDSSRGKSTTQIVAGSVWGGGGEKGYLESWRTTANGLEIFAEIHNDGLGCLDEIGEIDARQLGEAVYMLANGQGKGRMTKSIGSRKRLTWRMLFLSSGNLTLNQHMESVGRAAHAALEVRLISITCDAGENMGMFENVHGFEDSKAFAEFLTNAACRCYGAPIRDFLKHFSSNQLRIAGQVRQRMETFARDTIPATASSEIRRAGRRFGLAVAAGELATEQGLTGWDPREVASLINKCLQDWMRTREPSDTDRGVRAVKQFLELHEASRFQNFEPGNMKLDGSYPTEKIINRAGFWRTAEDGKTREYLFLPEVFRSEVCRGFDMQTVLQALKDKNLLSTGKEGKNSQSIYIPNVGQQRLYVISSNILQ